MNDDDFVQLLRKHVPTIGVISRPKLTWTLPHVPVKVPDLEKLFAEPEPVKLKIRKEIRAKEKVQSNVSLIRRAVDDVIETLVEKAVKGNVSQKAIDKVVQSAVTESMGDAVSDSLEEASKDALKLRKEIKKLEKSLAEISRLKQSNEPNVKVKVDDTKDIREELKRIGELVNKISKYDYGGSSLNVLTAGTPIGFTTALNFKSGFTTKLNGAGYIDVTSAAGGTQIYGEIVSGSGTSFTLAHTPLSGIALYGRGQRITNFTLVGTAITTSDTWATGDLTADYSY